MSLLSLAWGKHANHVEEKGYEGNLEASAFPDWKSVVEQLRGNPKEIWSVVETIGKLL